MTDEWQRRGATLSDNTACKEFGLTRDELVAAIRAGKLQYRKGSLYGNPFFRLLRREVEALVEGLQGAACLKDRKVKAELAEIDREMRRLKKQLVELEGRRAKLMGDRGAV